MTFVEITVLVESTVEETVEVGEQYTDRDLLDAYQTLHPFDNAIAIEWHEEQRKM